MREEFERYIEVILEQELAQAETAYPEDDGGSLQVVENDGRVIGTFGIQRASSRCAELRRMYLRAKFRGNQIAKCMLGQAEAIAHKYGYSCLVLSTAEIQQAAVKFYTKNGFTQVESKVENTMSVKTVGGGLKRIHFKKPIIAIDTVCQ